MEIRINLTNNDKIKIPTLYLTFSQKCKNRISNYEKATYLKFNNLIRLFWRGTSPRDLMNIQSVLQLCTYIRHCSALNWN